MNLTFLIGNGFDINIGMKTRYSDFYKYYNSVPSTNDLILNLKKSININFENWADLEFKLGEYVENLNSPEDFDFVFSDIQKHLGIYLKEEEQKYEFQNAEAYSQLTFDFRHFTNYLRKGDAKEVESFLNKFGDEWKINIVTFNYTRSLEEILKFSNKDKALIPYKTIFDNEIYIHQVLHIHGYTDLRMIFGVNDLMQIGSESLRNHKRIQNAFVKPRCNKIQKHLVDDECIEIINQSHLLCTFGLSLGETDKFWWNLIGKRLNSANAKMVLFYKDKDVFPPNQEWRIGEKEDDIKELFKIRAELDNIVDENIFIGHNSKMFNLEIFEKEGL